MVIHLAYIRLNNKTKNGIVLLSTNTKRDNIRNNYRNI